MCCVTFVLEAHVLQQLRVGAELQRHTNGPRPLIELAVIDRHLQIEMTEVGTAEAFGEPQALTMRVADGVEPGFVVETRRFNNEVVANPTPDRISDPCGIRIARERPPVRKDLPVCTSRLVQDDGQSSVLNDLHWRRLHPRHWQAGRQASRKRKILAKIRPALSDQCAGMRFSRNRYLRQLRVEKRDISRWPADPRFRAGPSMFRRDRASVPAPKDSVSHPVTEEHREPDSSTIGQ